MGCNFTLDSIAIGDLQGTPPAVGAKKSSAHHIEAISKARVLPQSSGVKSGTA